ncbi:MAG: 2-phospho-L-lactate guanylyltransferase [Geminicoccaceae bacterium]
MTDSGLWAILPIKNIEDAKQRLAGFIGKAERQALFRAMIEDVLEALSRSATLSGILVVTRDPEAKRLARIYDARVLIEKRNAGHTAASSFGAETLAREGVAGMLQVPGDLPLLNANDVDALIAAHGEAPAVTIAPSRDKLGSNGVACSPPDLLPLRFGDDSFFPHLKRARDLGIEPRVLERDGFALDVDTPDDLMTFLASPSTTRAYRYLIESGVADRISNDRSLQSSSP